MDTIRAITHSIVPKLLSLGYVLCPSIYNDLDFKSYSVANGCRQIRFAVYCDRIVVFNPNVEGFNIEDYTRDYDLIDRDSISNFLDCVIESLGSSKLI